MVAESLMKIYQQVRSHNALSFREKQIQSYVKNGRRPWSTGYHSYKEDLIKASLHDESLLQKFYSDLSLPENYGEFVDERIVEYPWLISRIDPKSSKLLDAGSILNFSYILQHSNLSNKDISIVTLEPEQSCFWKKRISYLFADLRDLPFRDNWFDEIVSISTLEHVGMDNSIYSSSRKWQERQSLDFLKAVSEFKRIIKPGGKVYITVPYGKYTDFGWYQQFNAELIDRLIDNFEPAKVIETYFCYESSGWKFGDKQYCQKFEGFNIHDTKHFNPNSTKDYDPDYAACSRAIAALELWK